jgi:hypothetical protein
MSMRQTIGLGLAVLLAGPAVALGPAAAPAVAAPASAAGPAGAGAAAASACGVDLGTVDHPPLALRLHGVRRVYPAGGGWSPIRLTLRNRLGRRCAGVRPVMVFGVRAGGLRQGDVRLQWRRGSGGWRPVPLLAEQTALARAAVLTGQTGPSRGLAVPAGGRTAVPMRMRIGRGAPPGQWLTMAVGFEPVLLAGRPVPLPVGISDPALFRVVRAGGWARGRSRWRGHGAAAGRPELAETGVGIGAGTGAGTARGGRRPGRAAARRRQRAAAAQAAGAMNSSRSRRSSASVRPCSRRKAAAPPCRSTVRSRNSAIRSGWTGCETRSTPYSSR